MTYKEYRVLRENEAPCIDGMSRSERNKFIRAMRRSFYYYRIFMTLEHDELAIACNHFMDKLRKITGVDMLSRDKE